MEEVKEDNRVRNLEDTLVYIHTMWSNPYMRYIISKALVNDFKFLDTNSED